MNLFLCKTPVQVLRAIQLTYYNENFHDSDICVFRTFNQADFLATNIKKTKIFHNVYIFDNIFFEYIKYSYIGCYIHKNEFSNILKNEYTSLCIFNTISYDSFSAYNHLKKKAKIIYIEDSPMLFHFLLPSNKLRKKLNFLKLDFPIYNIDEWYFSEPSLMQSEITNNSPVFKLPHLDVNDTKFKEMVNSVYAYKPNMEFEKYDVFLMEESFYNDKCLTNDADYNFFRSLKNKYPDIKFAVKLHPRTKFNRFTEDFNCIGNSYTPWEVIMLNIDLSKKLFISLSCSTMVSSKFLYDLEIPCVMLYRLLGDNVRKLNGELYYSKDYTNLLDKLEYIYTDKTKMCIANSVEEVYKMIENLH